LRTKTAKRVKEGNYERSGGYKNRRKQKEEHSKRQREEVRK
jgi:hypothetical protein